MANNKKENHDRQGNNNRERNSIASSFSRLVEYFDAERLAQRKEFLKRERENNKLSSRQDRPKKSGKKPKPKSMTFDQKLDLTYQWLEATYPHLFVSDGCVLLDHFILRDIKSEYKNNQLKKGYPQDLVIKAAISRYKESMGYLECVRAGATRYNLKGEACGMITKEEEEAAQKILDNL